MNAQHPNLPKADNDILKIDSMIEHSLKIFRGLTIKSYKESDPPRRLICALRKTDYIAPEDDKWRHSDSQSDDEEPELKKKMEEKFGRKDSDSSESDSDGDDDGNDGGDVGAGAASAPGTAGASTAGTAGDTSAGEDEEDTESDDNPPEPGYEVYFDERGVKRVRRIRQEDDAEYVPWDTEAERLKKKQTVARRKKKARKYIDSSSTQQSVPQQEPTQEAEMDPNLGFTATEASAMVSSPPRSSEPTPLVTSTPETPTVTPQEPAPSIASTIRATTSQPASEHRQTIFSRMPQDEKIDFLFSQLQAVLGQINRQTAVINVTKGNMMKQ
ncbi:hypothetical protein HanHA89_Chr17g0709261 [Helianthus annuus]|nr:hypothetical protein HanHA89_Chr17g0709261 [Helianthus annuus]